MFGWICVDGCKSVTANDEEFVPYMPCGPIFIEALRDSLQRYGKRLNEALYRLLHTHLPTPLRVNSKECDGEMHSIEMRGGGQLGLVITINDTQYAFSYQAPSSSELRRVLTEGMPNVVDRSNVRASMCDILACVDDEERWAPLFINGLDSECFRKKLEAWEMAHTNRALTSPATGSDICIWDWKSSIQTPRFDYV